MKEDENILKDPFPFEFLLILDFFPFRINEKVHYSCTFWGSLLQK